MVDKKQFKDEKGRYIVQGLFLEDRYNTDIAVYTWAGEDKTYKGVVYPSLKRLYLEEGDPEEYLFAQKHLFDWPHWKRLCNNAMVGRHIDEWREELILSLRSEGLASIIDLAVNEKSYQAAKFLSEEGWKRNKVGRPSKEDIEGRIERDAKIQKEFDADIAKLDNHRASKGK